MIDSSDSHEGSTDPDSFGSFMYGAQSSTDHYPSYQNNELADSARITADTWLGLEGHEHHVAAQDVGLPAYTLDKANEDFDIDRCKALMIDRGWCLHHVSHLSHHYDAAVMHRFAAIDRRNGRPEDHASCLQQEHCVAYNTPSMQEYRTAHTQTCPGESCYTVKVPYATLHRVLRSGGTPLVSIHQNSSGELYIKVHRRRLWSKYVSVSHLWADGLGNPIENSLPACQIEQLQFDLQVIATKYRCGRLTYGKSDKGFMPICPPTYRLTYGTNVWQGLGDAKTTAYTREMVNPLFWMDTLCVPVQSEFQELRELCMEQMLSIYARSVFTFIFDRELMTIEWGRAQRGPEAWPNEWHFAYLIAASAWMSRGWTLQEGVKSRQVVFKCKDALFHLDREWVEQAERSLGADQSDILDSLGYHFLRDSNGTMDFRKFKRTWNELAGRSTTVAADLDVVLASCLGLSYSQVRKIDTASRLQHMIFSLERLPLSLFFNTGPRLHVGENHRNRWVPVEVGRNLLKGTSAFSPPPRGVSKYSDEGMRLKLTINKDVDVIFVDHVLPAVADYEMFTNNNMWQVHTYLPAADEFDASGYRATCVILQRSPSQFHTTVKGACFYVQHLSSMYDNGQEVPVLEMIYFCPIEASKMAWDSSMSPKASSVDTIGPCRILDRDAKLAVLVGRPSGQIRLIGNADCA